MQWKLKVHVDGDVVGVTADQRDCAAWELESFGCATGSAFDTKPMLFTRFLAYSALRREGRIDGRPTFKAWSEVVELVDFDDVDEDDEEEGPTQTDPSSGD